MRDKIAKLYHAIAYQRWLGKAESIEYFTNPKSDKIEPEDFVAEVHHLANEPLDPLLASSDAKYISWLVSSCFFCSYFFYFINLKYAIALFFF